MTTMKEFVKSGITGQTFREITEKFGKPFKSLGEEDAVMSVYALGFAWFRERERLPLPAAYDRAMGSTVDQIESLFQDENEKGVKAEVDFASQPSTTTP